MTSRGRFVVWIALASLGLVAGAPATAATGIRVARVDLRDYPTVRLTIVTRTPDPRPPLVAEDGAPAAGVQAENLGQRASVVLAIDRSHSMHGQTLSHALAASRAFLASKPSGYQVSILTFASRPQQLSSFSTSTTDADSALASVGIDPRAGTTLFDAVVLASKALQGTGSPGRVIVLITDGQETTSRATIHKAIDAAQTSHVIIYPIAIKDTTFTPGLLRTLAAGTGGKMFVAGPGQSLVGTYALIASQLRRTWELSYYTAVRPGASIDLQASGPNGETARTRIPIPASAPTPASSVLPFTELAIAVCVLLGLAVGAALLRQTIRRFHAGRDPY